MSDSISRLPRSLYRAQDVQQLDQIAIRDCGIDGFKLMQRAGAVVLTALLEHWPQTRMVRIFAGKGNNGGDGYVVARLAQEQGLHVEVIQVGAVDQLQGDARKAWEWAREKQVCVQGLGEYLAQEETIAGIVAPHAAVVDALLGTGLDREVSGEYVLAINHINDITLRKNAINTQIVPVVAIDIPSGLSADTGCPLGAAVRANLTVTFIGMKQGLLTGRGREFAGSILFNNLDVPDKIYSSKSSPEVAAQRIDINDATRHLLPRAIASHKGLHGHVVVVGGDEGYGGAVLLAAEAALRTGAGLVSVITRSVHRPAILARRPELMVLGTEDENTAIQALLDKASVIVVGPGLGQGQWSRNLLQSALGTQSARQTPLVIDADGLRLLAEKPLKSVGVRRPQWILTPHPGEAAQLLDSSTDAIQADRFAAVKALQTRWGGYCLLKGSGSLICCPDEDRQQLFLSTEGNPGMATAGMGDVLSGIIAGLVAQGLPLADALRCATVIHGEAGDLAAQHSGQRGLLASDLFALIPQLVNPA